MGLSSQLSPFRRQLQALQKMDDTRLDVLAALSLTFDVIRGSQSLSGTRLLVLSLAMSVAAMKGAGSDSTMKESLRSDMKKIFAQVKIFADWQRRGRCACDCSMLPWRIDLLGPFLGQLYRDGGSRRSASSTSSLPILILFSS